MDRTDLGSSIPLTEPLTEREQEILRLKANGLSNPEIADRLVLALSTVKWYVRQIYGKLGAENHHQAVTRARALGLLEPATTPTGRPRHNLPVQTTPFVGRTRELDDLTALLANPDVRLVTLLGPGGMGKTRLALEAAWRLVEPERRGEGWVSFPDGVYFVPLQPLDSPDDILWTVAEAVEYPFQSDGREPQRQVLDFFREKRALLVMDNFESVLEGAGLVSIILQAAPGVQVLATSRETLNLTAETVYSLEGLPFPEREGGQDSLDYDAARLFTQGARRACADFALQPDDLAPLARICRLVEGMPLALLLAAAWVEVLSVEEIADEIARSFDFLTAEIRDVPRRQWSIRAVFEPTWNRLTDHERDVFMRFAVFRGGCTREAAQTVTGADLRTLRALIKKALLDRHSAGRYEMHELMRQYAEQQLEAASEVDSTRDAHCTYYFKFLYERETGLEGEDQLAALAKLDHEIENIEAAWSRALETQQYLDLAHAVHILGTYYSMRGIPVDGEALFDRAATELRKHPSNRERDQLLGKVLLQQAELGLQLFHYERARQLLKDSHPLVDMQDDQRFKALFAFLQGWQAIWGPFRDITLDEDQIRQYFGQALQLYRAIDYPRGIALALHWIGNSYWASGPELSSRDQDLLRAQQYLLEARAIQEEIGDIFGLAHTLMNLGNIASTARRPDEGKALLLKSLALREQIGNRVQIAHTLHNLGVNALEMESVAEAKQFLQASVAHYRDMGVVSHAAWDLCSLGDIAQGESDFEAARAFYLKGLALVTQTEHSQLNADLRSRLAWVALALGNYDEAETLIEQVHQGSSALNQSYAMRALFLKGWIALARSNYGRAQELFETSLQIGQELAIQKHVAECRVSLAISLFRQDNIDQARQHLQASLAFYRDNAARMIFDPLTHKTLLAEALGPMGAIDGARGDYATARAHLQEALALAWDTPSIATALGVIATTAEILADQAQPERAVEIGALVQCNARSYAIDKTRVIQLLAELEATLPPDIYAAAVERGQALDLDAVVAELLAESGP